MITQRGKRRRGDGRGEGTLSYTKIYAYFLWLPDSMCILEISIRHRGICCFRHAYWCPLRPGMTMALITLLPDLHYQAFS